MKIKPELSKKNEHWIEKHRYYELKHFCLQYPIWKKAYSGINNLMTNHIDLIPPSKTNKHLSPTEKCAEAKLYYAARMDLLRKTAEATHPVLGKYIFIGVTTGKSYETIKSKDDIPCGKELYYKLYRKFFWLLNKSRDNI